jgi:hypothetical protein
MSNTDVIIDQLSAEVDRLIKRIDHYTKAKTKHRVVFEHHMDTPDDGDHGSSSNFGYGDGDSNPSASADNSDNDDDGDNDNPDNELPDEDEDEDAVVAKALDGSDSNSYLVNRNDGSNRPGALKTSTHAQPRHKFEALTLKIKNDRGVSATEAQAIARREYPETFRSFQEHSNTYSGRTSKAAPTTFEQLVSAEMKKGVTREIAGQRVMQAHGSHALRHRSINKRDWGTIAAEDELLKRADHIWSNSSLSRTEALREARLANPRLFKFLSRGSV